jgi:vacuolar-type H+-ATPase subunit I/STV1
LSGDKKKDLAAIKEFLDEWKQYGRIPYNKKHINGKFNKIIDALFKKVGVSKQESELLKYGNKVQELAKTEDNHAIGNERVFIRRKINESKSEIRQLENNLQFFSDDSEDNPLVKEVINNINKQKETLQTWKEKLKKLNILENRLNREAEEEEDGSEEE